MYGSQEPQLLFMFTFCYHIIWRIKMNKDLDNLSRQVFAVDKSSRQDIIHLDKLLRSITKDE